MFLTSRILADSIKLLRKRYFCWVVFVIFLLILKPIFDNSQFFNIVMDGLNFYINGIVASGIWKSPLLELLVFIILSLCTYFLAAYCVDNNLLSFFLKSKSEYLRRIVITVCFYLAFNIISFFIIGSLSGLDNSFIDYLIRIFLNISLVMIISGVIFSPIGMSKVSILKSLNPYFASITITVLGISLVYSIISYCFLYSMVQVSANQENGILFSFIDIITPVQKFFWIDILQIIVNSIIYSYITCFVYVILKNVRVKEYKTMY